MNDEIFTHTREFSSNLFLKFDRHVRFNDRFPTKAEFVFSQDGDFCKVVGSLKPKVIRVDFVDFFGSYARPVYKIETEEYFVSPKVVLYLDYKFELLKKEIDHWRWLNIGEERLIEKVRKQVLKIYESIHEG